MSVSVYTGKTKRRNRRSFSGSGTWRKTVRVDRIVRRRICWNSTAAGLMRIGFVPDSQGVNEGGDYPLKSGLIEAQGKPQHRGRANCDRVARPHFFVVTNKKPVAQTPRQASDYPVTGFSKLQNRRRASVCRSTPLRGRV